MASEQRRLAVGYPKVCNPANVMATVVVTSKLATPKLRSRPVVTVDVALTLLPE